MMDFKATKPIVYVGAVAELFRFRLDEFEERLRSSLKLIKEVSRQNFDFTIRLKPNAYQKLLDSFQKIAELCP